MSPESLDYYKALGVRIALLRKARGMTQAELARAIGVSQQAVFAYEIAERRVSVFILVKLAKVFEITVEVLMGVTRPVRMPKRRLSPRAADGAIQDAAAIRRPHHRYARSSEPALTGAPLQTTPPRAGFFASRENVGRQGLRSAPHQ